MTETVTGNDESILEDLTPFVLLIQEQHINFPCESLCQFFSFSSLQLDLKLFSLRLYNSELLYIKTLIPDENINGIGISIDDIIEDNFLRMNLSKMIAYGDRGMSVGVEGNGFEGDFGYAFHDRNRNYRD